jgi:phosphate-selective porin
MGRDTTEEGMYYVHPEEAIPERGPATAMRRVGALLERMGPDQVIQGAAMASVAQGTSAAGASVGPRTVNVGNQMPSGATTNTTENRTVYEIKGDVFAQDSRSFEQKVSEAGRRWDRDVGDRNARR